MPAINLVQVSIYFVVLLFSLTVHEMAHAWTADRLGDPTARLRGRISLNPLVHADLIGTVLFPLIALIGNVPLLGWAKPVPVMISQLRHPRRDAMLVAAAGPASNVLIAVVASLGLRILAGVPVSEGGPEIVPPLAALMYVALRLNLMLAFFNLIPIPPLDGGNILAGVLPRSFALRYDAFVRPYGFLLLYALIFTGVLNTIVYGPSQALASLLLPSSIS